MNVIQKYVRTFLNSILKSKSLFLLFPVVLKYEGDEIVKAEDICNLMYRPYKYSLALRDERFPNKETYVGFFIMES